MAKTTRKNGEGGFDDDLSEQNRNENTGGSGNEQQSRLPLILASGSLGRRLLMEAAGHEFTVRPANVDEPTGEEFFESVHSGRKTPHGRGETDIRQFVQYVCWLKAAAVAPTITEGIVIAADTVSWIDGEVIGKPEDADDARRILRKLGGRDHELWTGTVLWRRPDDLQFAWQECSRVHFRNLTEEELDTYLATRKWEGCSGAYAIKDHDDPYVRVVEGSLSNVVGLPMETLEGVLKMALEK